MDPKPVRIAILVSTSYGFGREVIRGVMSFARAQSNWALRREEPHTDVIPWLRKWKPHGLITHIESAQLLKALRSLRVPWIDLTYHVVGQETPVIWQDDPRAGQMVAEYFLGKGYRDFAFVGYRSHQYSLARQAGFEKAVAAAGGSVHLLLRDELPPRPTPRRNWTTERRELSRWLLSLPKPIGLMACHDDLGAEVVDVCGQSGIAVPEQLAVVGVEDDDLICFTTQPNLSSVRMPNEAIGWHAAEHIAALLRGREARRIVLPPVGVITRGSSDRVASSDPIVASALTYMREHIAEAFQVEAVLEHVRVSQSMLERRFRATLGRTPLAEIRRLRVERAKMLLAETTFPMSRVAALCGFNSTVRFSTVFRELAGRTPTAFRRSMSTDNASPA